MKKITVAKRQSTVRLEDGKEVKEGGEWRARDRWDGVVGDAPLSEMMIVQFTNQASKQSVIKRTTIKNTEQHPRISRFRTKENVITIFPLVATLVPTQLEKYLSVSYPSIAVHIAFLKLIIMLFCRKVPSCKRHLPRKWLAQRVCSFKALSLAHSYHLSPEQTIEVLTSAEKDKFKLSQHIAT